MLEHPHSMVGTTAKAVHHHVDNQHTSAALSFYPEKANRKHGHTYKLLTLVHPIPQA